MKPKPQAQLGNRDALRDALQTALPQTFEEALAGGYEPAIDSRANGEPLDWFKNSWDGETLTCQRELVMIRYNAELQTWDSLRVPVCVHASVTGAAFAHRREHARDDTDVAVNRLLAGVAASLGV